MRPVAPASVTGKANTVLVAGTGKDVVAVVAQVCAELASKDHGDAESIISCRSVDDRVQRHLQESLGRLFKTTATALGLDSPAFRISLTNLGAASVQDRPLAIQGFSADVPVAMACLSVWLGIPVSPTILFTGHVADAQGAVRMVNQLPAKLHAAQGNKAIQKVLCPDPNADDSVVKLLPEEHDAIAEAIRGARRNLDVTLIRSVDDALRVAFTEEDVLVAAFRRGYYEREFADTETANPVPFLSDSLFPRYWSCLADSLRSGTNARNLLAAWVAYAETTRAYPEGCGRALLRQLAALPGATRNLRVRFPLLTDEEIAVLANMAEPGDVPDLRRLFDAVYGDRFSTVEISEVCAQDESASTTDLAANEQLRVLLAAIAPEEMARQVRTPVDEARATFPLVSITARSVQECQDTVSAFYQHLCAHLGIEHVDADAQSLAPEAFALLERAFARQGGAKAAYAEAVQGTRGRLRLICDQLAEQFKAEQEELRVEWTFRRALDALDYDGRCELVKAFLDMVRPYLHPEEEASPPERFVDGLRPLVRAYVRSMDHVKETLRAM